MLVRCLYASRAVQPLVGSVLDEIMKQSHRNNPQKGITGLLCSTSDIFVQVLEGGRDEVSCLFGIIIRDERHYDVQMLMLEEITARRFGNWTMGRVNARAINTGLLLKHSVRAELNPFVMPGHATMALMTELVETGSIAGRTGS